MYIVTGGLGFIGSHIVERLHNLGNRVLIVDDIDGYGEAKITERLRYISRCASSIDGIVSLNDFYKNLDKYIGSRCEGVFHQGAISSTTEIVGLMSLNTECSRKLIDTCMVAGVPIVYASSAACIS